MRQVTLTIDRQQIAVPQETTVLEAACSAGIYIPTLCFDDDLEPYGACRMCIVEIDGIKAARKPDKDKGLNLLKFE